MSKYRIEHDELGFWVVDLDGNNVSDPVETYGEALAIATESADDEARERRALTSAYQAYA